MKETHRLGHNQGMNEEFELRKRLQEADPGRSAPELSEGLVAQAAMAQPKRLGSFKVARFTVAAASFSIVALAITSVSLFQPAANEPLFTLAGASQGEALSSDASASTQEMGAAEPDRMGADSMMIWPGFFYDYIPGDLANEPGRGKVYQAQLVGNPSEILSRIAGFFGIEAEPALDEWSTDEYPSYSIQEENAWLGMYFSGTGSWYYSNWNSDSYNCVVSSDEDDLSRNEDCNPKPTPELIPIESDLVLQAARAFEELGFPVESSRARVWRGEWGASVSFPNIQNGIDTGMDFSAGWDARGDLNYLSGYSFTLVDRGEFDTIGAFDAVARISDGRWMGAAPYQYYENLSISSNDAPTSSLAREDEAELGVESPEPIFEEPERIELRIESAKAVTLSVFDAAGNYWFVPGYLLYNEQGWFDSIISLEEGVIELPEPFDYEIMPMIEPESEG